MTSEMLRNIMIAGTLLAVFLAAFAPKNRYISLFFMTSLLASYVSTASMIVAMIAVIKTPDGLEMVIQLETLFLAVVMAAVIYIPIAILMLSVASHYQDKGTIQTVLGPNLD